MQGILEKVWNIGAPKQGSGLEAASRRTLVLGCSLSHEFSPEAPLAQVLEAPETSKYMLSYMKGQSKSMSETSTLTIEQTEEGATEARTTATPHSKVNGSSSPQGTAVGNVDGSSSPQGAAVGNVDGSNSPRGCPRQPRRLKQSTKT